MASQARLISLAALLAAVAAASCHGAGGREAPGDAKSAMEASAALRDGGAPAVEGPAIWGVLGDPRFAEARAFEASARHADAAKSFEASLALASLSGAQLFEARYVEGRLRASAGDDLGAAQAFDAVLGADGGTETLADYARLRAAEAWERAGKADEAASRATAVSPSFVLDDEARLVAAEAAAALGDRAKAVPIWRDHLAKHPRGTRWVDTAARLAAALLDGVDGDAKSHAREAYELAARILVEAPTFEDTTQAQTLRRNAVALDPALPSELSLDERIKRARALLDANQADKARGEIEAVVRAVPAKEKKDGTDLACRAETTRAQILAKAHKNGPAKPAELRADAWGDAIRACANQGEALASALFNGAKASNAAQRPDEALARYGRIESEFPKQRLADDARLATAMILHDRGDVARFESLLSTLPDDYPEGDMRSEALFRVALDRMARGDWEGAKAPLDRAAGIDATSHHWAIAGRAAYFRARASAKTGDLEDAKRRWADVVKGFPLAFYMAESYARLSEADPALARATLEAAEAAEPPGPFITRDHPEMQKPEFARALALLEVGETDAARKEFLASGALVDAADPELVWVVASLFDRAGAAEVGHSFARGRLSDYLSHFPAGRWRFAWEAAFPRAFLDEVEKVATDDHVPAPLVWGVMREESAFIPDVRSPANAHGLMQLMPATARLIAKGTMPTDDAALHEPRTSITLGVQLLASLRATFGGNPALAIPAYNAGAGAVRAWLKARPGDDFDLWIEQIPFDETRGYIKRVLASELAYATLYAPDAAKEVLGLPARADPGAP